MKVDASASIARPPAEVYQLLLADLRKESSATADPAGLYAARSDDIRVGTVLAFDLKSGSPEPVTVTHLESGRQIGLGGGEGRLRFDVLWRLDAEAPGTRLNQRVDLKLRGAARLLTPFLPIVRKMLRAGSEALLTRFKSDFESPH